jgi:hypothetical protein
LLDTDDSLITNLVKTQIDSSRDTLAFFRKVHQINRASLEQLHLPPLAIQLGKWAVVALGVWILWAFLRPVLGPHLGFGQEPGLRRIPPSRSIPTLRSSLSVDAKVGRGTRNASTSQMGKSGLKVAKRPRPKKDHGPSLPRW